MRDDNPVGDATDRARRNAERLSKVAAIRDALLSGDLGIVGALITEPAGAKRNGVEAMMMMSVLGTSSVREVSLA